jgi:hypothetical protein
VELFGEANTFARLLPKLIRSYGLDALDDRAMMRRSRGRRRTSTTAMSDDVRKLLTMLSQLPALRRPAIGLGEDLRFETPDTVAAALVHDGQVVHLSAFNRVIL